MLVSLRIVSRTPTPLYFSDIFPLDGLLSNPQTLCTCVSISIVAWRPFHSPLPRRFPPTALRRGREQVNIILVGDAAFLIYWKAVLHGSMFARRPVDYLTSISFPISSWWSLATSNTISMWGGQRRPPLPIASHRFDFKSIFLQHFLSRHFIVFIPSFFFLGSLKGHCGSHTEQCAKTRST